MDGLAGGVGVIACLWLFVVAVLNHDTAVAVMLAALAGSLLGFLRYNFHPAKIYMGDAGSLFLGLMLGALAMIGKYTAENPVAIVSPVLILGVPVFDTLFVMHLRRLRGISMFLGSLDHFPLRLRQRPFTVLQVVGVTYAVAIALGGVALWMMFVTTATALGMVGTVLVLAGLATVWLKRFDVPRGSGAGLPAEPSTEPARRAP
jgi:UDP-GlcNAc:undecaprenyl-phosphate GlcNAc-1-phosphate transferase